jgi:hypothetical protein
MSHAAAVQRLEEIERQRLDLFNLDRSAWTSAQWDAQTDKLIRLAELEQEARLSLERSHKMHLAIPARAGG